MREKSNANQITAWTTDNELTSYTVWPDNEIQIQGTLPPTEFLQVQNTFRKIW